MKFSLRLFAALLVVLLLIPTLGVAAAEGFSYTYDTDDKSVAVPTPYETYAVLSGKDTFGGAALSEPTDFYATETELYILDTGNDRVVVLDNTLTFSREIRLQKDGAEVAFSDALGICVDKNGSIYIADKGAQTVYVTDAQGVVQWTVDAPPRRQGGRRF